MTESDSTVSIFFVGLFALGILIIAHTGRGSAEEIEVLFGDISQVTTKDLYPLLAIFVFLLVYLKYYWRTLLLIVLNKDLANVEGLAVRKHSYILLTLCGVTVAAALKVMGVTLMTSLILVPPMIALRLAKTLTGVVAYSVAAGLVIVSVGFLLSLFFTLPSGATIAVFGFALFLIISLLKK
jgi:zinc transport system permease protein